MSLDIVFIIGYLNVLFYASVISIKLSERPLCDSVHINLRCLILTPFDIGIIMSCKNTSLHTVMQEETQVYQIEQLQHLDSELMYGKNKKVFHPLPSSVA